MTSIDSRTPSRITAARRRARAVKVVAAGAAAAGFGLLSVVVRGAHPGAAATPAADGGSLALSQKISQEAQSSQSFFSGGSVSPSSGSGAPQASTHTS